MYNNPFYIPGYSMPLTAPTLMRGLPQTGLIANTARTAGTSGLFSKLGTSLSGIKSINWGGLINNTSKTLGIINQTIPIVKQVGPMVNNMRSMIQVASLFKDETDRTIPQKNNNIQNNKQIINIEQTQMTNNRTHNNSTNSIKIENNKNEYDESPTFFINS